MAKKSTSEIRKFMIVSLVQPPNEGFKARFWPREMKLASELLEQFPNEDFWRALRLDRKLNSLAALKMKNLADDLRGRFNRFTSGAAVATNRSLEIFDEKFGESSGIISKPRRYIADYLR